MRRYEVQGAPATPELRGEWDGRAWGQIHTADLDQFRVEGSSHKPRVQAKIAYDDQNIYVFWRVHDRYVFTQRTQYNDHTHRDSCVEFFFQPHGPGTPHFA